MIRQTLAVAAWLGSGGLALLGLYWLLINTPDSSALLLSLSALLVVAMLAVAAVVTNTAVLRYGGHPPRAAVPRAVRGIHRFLLAAVPVAAAAWALRRGDDWVALHAGEISAWFIATLDWTETGPLFEVARYVSVWLRWVVVPVLALAALARMLGRDGNRDVPAPPVRRALWRTLLVATMAFVLFVVLPWQLMAWRPGGLPPTWIEPAVAVVRLSALGFAMAVGAAVMVGAAARR